MDTHSADGLHGNRHVIEQLEVLDTVEIHSEYRRRVRRLIFAACGVTGAIGAAMVGLYYVGDPSQLGRWREASLRVGEVILTTAIVTALYEGFTNARYLGVIKALFQDALKPLKEEVPRLEDGIEKLQRTVEIARGAVESGITAVYSNRLEALTQIRDALQQAAAGDHPHWSVAPGKLDGNQTTVVDLVGISLGDFLCPHGFLYGIIRDIVADPVSRVRLRVLIVDHSSEVALERAKREEPQHFKPGGGGYEKTKCHDELKTATHVAEGYLARFSERFEYKTYAVAPLCFVVVIGETMFMESYHYAGRGGEAPMLKIALHPSRGSSSLSRLFQIYVRHFDALWMSREEEAGSVAASPPMLVS
jgi:hypothetical protein